MSHGSSFRRDLCVAQSASADVGECMLHHAHHSDAEKWPVSWLAAHGPTYGHDLMDCTRAGFDCCSWPPALRYDLSMVGRNWWLRFYAPG